MTTFKHALRAAAAAVALWGGAGCSPYGAYCADQMDCRGGNDADARACEINLQRDEDIAFRRDCSAEWDDWVSCELEDAHCSSNVWGADSCGVKWLDLVDCQN